MRRYSTLAYALASLALPGLCLAQTPQSSSQQACITKINKAAAKVAKVQGREAAKCVKSVGKGKEVSLQTCVENDPDGKVAKAASKTDSVAAKSCSPPPDFGYNGSSTANAAAIDQAIALTRDMLGNNLDQAAIDGNVDSDGARCQAQITKRYAKIVDAKLKTFNVCKKSDLKDGSIESVQTLQTCLDDVEDDDKGSIAKSVGKLFDTLISHCTGVDLGTAFPGLCSGASNLIQCTDERVECRVCIMLNDMDGLSRDCDTFDDGDADGSCPPFVTTTTTLSTTTTTMAQADCPADEFLDVSQAPGAGPTYPAPTLNAFCDDDEVVVQSNSIPHYTFVPITPNPLAETNVEYRFPRNPQVAAQTTEIPLLGTVGVAVNGLPFFGPNEGAMPDPFGDPIVNAILDECLGHTAFIYHYHALAQKCLIESQLVAEPWLNADPPSDEPSPALAYAEDGFPIHGPYGCVDQACSQVIQYESGWENTGAQSVGCSSDLDCTGATFKCALAIVGGVKQNACVSTVQAWDNNEYVAKVGTEYLDECNGHTGPAGDYHYHATDTFPYILGCYRGTP